VALGVNVAAILRDIFAAKFNFVEMVPLDDVAEHYRLATVRGGAFDDGPLLQ
jgi:hypothetical protein